MSCQWCDSNWFVSKLGKCQPCMIKSVLFTFIALGLFSGLIAWGYPATHLYSLSALAFLTLFGVMTLLHLFFWLIRRLR